MSAQTMQRFHCKHCHNSASRKHGYLDQHSEDRQPDDPQHGESISQRFHGKLFMGSQQHKLLRRPRYNQPALVCRMRTLLGVVFLISEQRPPPTA